MRHRSLTLLLLAAALMACSAKQPAPKAQAPKAGKIQPQPSATGLQPKENEQLISDEQVGRTMAKAKCGDKSLEDTTSYFNHMRVPIDKMLNVQAYPEVHRGYFAEMGTRNC
jgi:hypothetical protein